MATVNEKMTAIADAIRAKTGGTDPLTLDGMATAIAGIETGGGGMSDEEYIKLIERTATEITLPEGLTVIGDGAFFGMTKARSNVIQFPSTLRQIKDYAFCSCMNAKFGELPNGVESIGMNAFDDCFKLAWTALPPSVTSIGQYAFSGCEELALTSLPDGITALPNYVFRRCSKLALSALPPNLAKIGAAAFDGCTSIQNIKIPASVATIDRQAFKGCTSLTEVTFEGTPSSIYATTTNAAFYGCTNLATINVPWAEGAVSGAPWGATNATINYNYTGG